MRYDCLQNAKGRNRAANFGTGRSYKDIFEEESFCEAMNPHKKTYVLYMTLIELIFIFIVSDSCFICLQKTPVHKMFEFFFQSAQIN